MKKITIKLKEKIDNSYEVLIEQDISKILLKFLKEKKLGEKYCIITDEKTKKLYGDALLRFLKKNGIKTKLISFKEGEKSKNLQTVEKLATEMVAKNFDRKDAIIALGGGITGDIAGFLASIYMRGIPYIQIPTTLLAMVDSCVGGKTGVDMASGKNLLGTFAQPKAVFLSINYLKTLPQTQIRNGLAEIIKYGVIKDAKLFKFIEQNLEKILSLDTEALINIIVRSIKIKADLVETDQKETGPRMILNYGHTLGHAIEKLSNFKLLHGYAISIGMVLANKLAIQKGLLSEKDAERIKNLFTKAGLPITTIKKPTKKDILSDKKRSGNKIKFILPRKIGKVDIVDIDINDPILN